MDRPSITVTFFKQHWLLFCTILSLSFLSAATVIILPILFRDFLATYMNGPSLFFDQKENILWVTVFIISLTAILNAISGIAASHWAYSAYEYFSKKLYMHVQYYNPSSFDSKEVGEISSLFTSDMKNVIPLFQYTIPIMVDSLFVLFFSVSILLYLDTTLATILLTPYIVIVIIFKKYSNNVQNKTNLLVKRMVTLNQEIIHILNKMLIVYFYNKYDKEATKINSSIGDFKNKAIKIEEEINYYSIPINFIKQMSLIVTIIFGAKMLERNETFLEDFSLFVFFSFLLTGPIIDLIKRIDMSRVGFASLDRINQALDKPLFITSENKNFKIPTFKKIEFDGVSYAYEKHNKIIDNISFTAEQGKILCICGKSGAGKSTIVNLMVGLLKPSVGDIQYDGLSISHINQHQLAQAFGYVTQIPKLDKGSVLENVTYVENCEISLNKVLDALKLAGFDDYENLLNSFIDREVSEGGSNFSVGQRQRLSIARALYKSSPFLIFDEPTASLDQTAKHQIKDSLKKIRNRGFGVVLITHDLYLLDVVDEIIFISEGKIIERGTYHDLKQLEQLKCYLSDEN